LSRFCAQHQEAAETFPIERRQYLRQKYGLTPEEFEAKLEAQGGVCAICEEQSDRWHIDHDHDCCPAPGESCGKCLRDVLCPKCNKGMGHFKDDPDRMMAAAANVLAHRDVIGELAADVLAGGDRDGTG
jgi:hypothetical protein